MSNVFDPPVTTANNNKVIKREEAEWSQRHRQTWRIENPITFIYIIEINKQRLVNDISLYSTYVHRT